MIASQEMNDSPPLDYFSAESDLETTSRCSEDNSVQDDYSSDDEETQLSEKFKNNPRELNSDSNLPGSKKHVIVPDIKSMSDQENFPPRNTFKKRLKKRGERKKFESLSGNVSVSSEDEFSVDDPDDDRMFRKKLSSPTGKDYTEKVEAIKKILKERPVNTHALKMAAMSEGGLLTDELRRKVWPRLVGLKELENRRKRNLAEIENHKYYKQVVLDVTRVLQRFPPGISDRQREKLQEQLTNLIVSVLHDLPNAHYYQGYHDVAITLLLVLRSELAYHVLKRLSITHLKEFMAETMESTQYLLNLVPCILRHTNPALYNHFERASLGTIYCLPWAITWFGHEIREYNTLLQIYDYLIASPPLAPFYLSAAFVASVEKELLEEECDMAMLHHKLSKLPAQQTHWSGIMSKASSMYINFPPKEMLEEVKSYVEEKRRKEEEYAIEVKRRAEAHRLAIQKRKMMMTPKKASKRHMMEFVIISVGVAVAASLYAFVKNDIILL